MASKDVGEDRAWTMRLSVQPDIGPAGIRRLLSGARAQGLSVAAAAALETPELVSRFGLTRAAAAAAARAWAAPHQVDDLLEGLRGAGVRVVFEGEPLYPPALSLLLGDAAPLVLFVRGDAGLPGRECVAVVGSRTPSALASAAAQAFSERQAAAGVSVVSGGARGIDSAAHRGALRCGSTVFVPPMGILRYRWKGAALPEVGHGSWCVLGQFPPREPLQAKYALIRNRTVAALSGAIVAFEPRDHGGTWHTCLAALCMRKPLFVVAARAGQPYRRALESLVRMGATALEPQCMPDAREFRELLAAHHSAPAIGQLPLFESRGHALPPEGGLRLAGQPGRRRPPVSGPARRGAPRGFD